jgi:hypothetical protein
MRNRFPGVCYRCGGHVAKNAGHFQRDRAAKCWRTQHAECAIVYRGTTVGHDGQPKGRRAVVEDVAALADRARTTKEEL